MTGHHLKEQLNRMSDAELDLDVHLYLSWAEEGEHAESIEIVEAKDQPYYKGDGPWTPEGRDQEKWRGVPRFQKLLYIRS